MAGTRLPHIKQRPPNRRQQRIVHQIILRKDAVPRWIRHKERQILLLQDQMQRTVVWQGPTPDMLGLIDRRLRPNSRDRYKGMLVDPAEPLNGELPDVLPQ